MKGQNFQVLYAFITKYGKIKLVNIDALETTSNGQSN